MPSHFSRFSSPSGNPGNSSRLLGGCLLPGRGGSARGGLPGPGGCACSFGGRGGSGPGGWGGIPACTEADPPPMDRQTPVKT